MRLTTVLVFLMILVFMGVILFVPNVPAFYDYYGFSGTAFVERPFIFITSIFLHSGLDHLLSNIIVLLFFGFAVEKEIGKMKLLALFLFGAAAGDVLSLLVYGPEIVSIGASAGIFALIGAGMVMRPVDISLYPLVIPMPLILLGLAYAAYNVYGFFFLADTNVSYASHFGGLFVGLVYGFVKTGIKKALLTLVIGLLTLALIVVLWLLIK